EGVCRILSAPESRKKKAEEGLMKLLGRDSRAAERQLAEAVEHKEILAAKQKEILGGTMAAGAEGEVLEDVPKAPATEDTIDIGELKAEEAKKGTAKGDAKARKNSKAKEKPKAAKKEAQRKKRK